MLTIRDPQMRALSLALFERWMVAHLRRHFAGPCAQLDDAALESLAARGLKAARRYGFDSEADLCRYVDLTVVLGADFDTDPGLPWAGAILKNPAIKSQAVRIEMLSEAACDHLRRLEQPAEFAAEEPEPEEEEEEEEEETGAWPEEEPVPDADEEEDEDDDDEEEA